MARIFQRTVGIQVGVIVVHTPLVREISHVQHVGRQRYGLRRTTGKQFVGQKVGLVKIILFLHRDVHRNVVAEVRIVNGLVNGIHRNFGPVVGIFQRVLNSALRKLQGRGPQPPAGGLAREIINSSGSLEVVDKRVVVYAGGYTGKQLRHLALKRNSGHFFGLQQGQAIQKPRQPVPVAPKVEIETQNGVVHRLIADGHAGQETSRGFTHIHGRHADAHIGAEGVIKARPDQPANRVLE